MPTTSGPHSSSENSNYHLVLTESELIILDDTLTELIENHDSEIDPKYLNDACKLHTLVSNLLSPPERQGTQEGAPVDTREYEYDFTKLGTEK